MLQKLQIVVEVKRGENKMRLKCVCKNCHYVYFKELPIVIVDECCPNCEDYCNIEIVAIDEVTKNE